MQAMQSGETSREQRRRGTKTRHASTSNTAVVCPIHKGDRAAKSQRTSGICQKVSRSKQMDGGTQLGASVERSKLHRVRENTQDQPGVDEAKSRAEAEQKTPHRTPWCKEGRKMQPKKITRRQESITKSCGDVGMSGSQKTPCLTHWCVHSCPICPNESVQKRE